MYFDILKDVSIHANPECITEQEERKNKQIYSVVADEIEQGRYILSVRLQTKPKKTIRTLYASDFNNCMDVCNEFLGHGTFYIIF